MCFLEIQVWFVVILKFCGLYTSDLEFLGFVNICWKSYVAIILCIQSNKSEISFALPKKKFVDQMKRGDGN